VSGKHTTGAITLRSNVVLDGDRWDLVPGELLFQIGRGRSASPLQHDEHMYYQLCSVCDRRIVEINLTGCTRCTAAPSPTSVLGEQDGHIRRVAAARRREEEENAAIAARSAFAAIGMSFDPPLGQAADSESSPERRDHSSG
jgi:hypothetical protein